MGETDDAVIGTITAYSVYGRYCAEVFVMKRDRSKDALKRADELVSELNADYDYLKRRQMQESRQIQNIELYQRAAEPVLKELASVGLRVRSIGELRASRVRYQPAIPILIRWLPEIENVHVREDIVRTLSVPWAAPEAVLVLIAEFERADGEQCDGLRWAAANGLAVLAGDVVVDQLIALVTNVKYGKSREMLALALGNCKDSHVVDVLIKLLADNQVVGHAVMALGKLKAKKAMPYIKAVMKNSTGWVHTEASKALASMDQS